MRYRARVDVVRKLLLLVVISLLPPIAPAEINVVKMRLQKGFLIVFDCEITPLQKLACVLDTGAFRTVVDTQVANRLRMPLAADEAFAATRRIKVQRVELPEIAFGTTTVRSLSVLVTDLTGFSDALGVHIDAVVGVDVLRRHTVTIDYRKRQLRFDETITSESSVALDPDSPFPVVSAKVAGQTVQLLLDTGADAISVFDGHLPSLERATLMEASGASVAGAVKAKAIRGIDVQIGAKTFTAQTVFIVPGEPGFTAYNGHFGVRTLNPSWFHFDFAHRQISWGK